MGLRLRLLSTWSAYAKESGPLPDLDLRLVEHQQKVWQALTRTDGPTVVFDTAMTGDGKTLAALLPIAKVERLGKGVFAYPTNELIRDQTKQVGRWLRTLKRALEVAHLDATSLAAYAESIEQPKHEALRDYAAHYDLVLTNPDILHLLQRFHYVPKHHPAARLAQTWMNRFRYIVFDEFHVFDAPQVASVLDGIAFIRANQNEAWPNRFLFLSATPNDLLLDALEHAGISYEVIQGRYTHGLQSSVEHRLILHEVDLELVPSERASGGIEAWVRENLEAIRRFFAEHPGSRGLLICNSVVAAKRLAAQLRGALARDSITVGENTGLTGPEVRKASLDADLIVATSAVDVGVDFLINLLVFESLDAGTFIQRLGRLGRHPGFETYRAIALVAPWAYEQVATLFANGAAVDRERFYHAVHEKVYRAPNRFERYLKRWGTILSTVRRVRLSKQRYHYQTLLKRYDLEVSRLIAPPNEQRLRALLHEHKEIVKELERFRGAGRLDVWVHDPRTGAVTQMGLLRVLSATEFELIERKEAQAISEDLGQPFYPNALGLYAVIKAYLEERESIVLRYGGYLSSLPLNQAQVRSGFEVEARTPALQKINRKLRPLPLVTCVADPVRFDLKSLRRRFRLPPLFELYNVEDLSGVVYPMAFGLDALLLDSVLFWHKELQSWIVGGSE